MDQHKFNETSAKKMKKKHHGSLMCAITNAKKTIGDEMKRPQAHINGSQFWLMARIRWAKYEPSGTPISPDAMATMPNLYETLSFCFVIFGWWWTMMDGGDGCELEFD